MGSVGGTGSTFDILQVSLVSSLSRGIGANCHQSLLIISFIYFFLSFSDGFVLLSHWWIFVSFRLISVQTFCNVVGRSVSRRGRHDKRFVAGFVVI